MDQTRKLELLRYLVGELRAERGEATLGACSIDWLWSAFRALVNTRPPWPASDDFLAAQDELLQGMLLETGISTADDATPSTADGRLRLWRGDITTLRVDAIVNAANAQMLGCWVAGHHCIDNAIHTFAGVQLRLECARIMEAQGHEEPTGQAKITNTYNLPAQRIIHTVGPIANGNPTALHFQQLASCYESCLELAAENGMRSIAFCCISTGVFGFPQRQAAEVAVQTVRGWLNAAPRDMVVVFNVFSDEDEAIYRELLDLG